MDPQALTRISKYLSRHLRHCPERLGLALEPGGWVMVADLLAACARDGRPLTRAELGEVVARNNKQRFSFDATGTRIRANQGHSVDVDLELSPMEPPDRLYHGTGSKSLEAIHRQGLCKMKRHHVHLSSDPETARRVGGRHGRPVVLEVNAAAMRRDGFVFFRSENGIWLAEHVPWHYLRPLEG